MSYVNLVMYGAVIPSYRSAKDKQKQQEEIRADDPRNRNKVRKFFESVE